MVAAVDDGGEYEMGADDPGFVSQKSHPRSLELPGRVADEKGIIRGAAQVVVEQGEALNS